MLVRIISGIYGHRSVMPDGTHRLTPVKPGETVEVGDAEGLRLIDLGVASKAEPDVETTHEAKTQEEPKNDVSGPVQYSVDMPIAFLRAAMRGRGLKYTVGMTKEQMVDALESYDDVPVLEAEDVVE